MMNDDILMGLMVIEIVARDLGYKRIVLSAGDIAEIVGCSRVAIHAIVNKGLKNAGELFCESWVD